MTIDQKRRSKVDVGSTKDVTMETYGSVVSRTYKAIHTKFKEGVKFAGIEFIEGSRSNNQFTALLPTSQCSTLKRTNDHLISGYSAVMKRQCQPAKCHTQVIVPLS